MANQAPTTTGWTAAKRGQRAMRRGSSRTETVLGVVRREGRLISRALRRWVDVEAYRLGASLTLYALLSMMPLLLLSLGVLHALLGDSALTRERAVAWFDASGSPDVAKLMSTTIENLSFSSSGSVIGVVVGAVGALVGASGVFAELDTTLNRVFKSERRFVTFREIARDFVLDRLWAFLFVLLTSVLVFGAAILGTVWDAFSKAHVGPHVLLRVLSGVVTIAMTSCAIGLCLKFVPERRVPWRAALHGGAVAAVGLILVRKPFGLLVVHLGDYAAYGAVGSVLAIVTWMYVSTLVFLIGASVAAVASEPLVDNAERDDRAR